MILALILLLSTPTPSMPATQNVEERTYEDVRSAIDRMRHDFEHVDTRRFENGSVVIRWRLANPPESHRTMTEGQRQTREFVAVDLTDHIDASGAKKRFDAMRRESFPDGEIPGLGDAAVFSSMRKWENSHTCIDFRIDRYYVRVLAPDGPTALRFAKTTSGVLQDLLKAKAD